MHLQSVLFIVGCVLALIVLVGAVLAKIPHNVGKRMYYYMTNERHASTPESDIQYGLIYKFNLSVKEANEAMDNYHQGQDWFVERFKDY